MRSNRALVGGFVGRLPRAVAARYRDDPLVTALLNLSERASPGAAAQPFAECQPPTP